jgi:plastocyanin
MKTKILYFGIAVLVLVIAGAFVYGRNQESPPAETQSNSTTTPPQDEVATGTDNTQPAETPSTTPPETKKPADTGGTNGRFAGEDEIQAPDVAVVEVVYNGSSFSPSSVTIKSGDIVIFKNASDSAFRPASNPHPSHTDYPGFDSVSSVAAGQSFQFKFTKVGSWGYHDHFNPAAKGTIIVK